MNDAFKCRLRAKELLLGPMLTLPSPEVAELMALAGFDWIWVELEHAPTDILTAQHMIQAVGGRCPCVVRTPWNDVVWIKRVLDTGCEGIVIPQVQTAAEAENAVRACHYPPAGVRGIGAARGQRYGMGLPDDVLSANSALTIIVQIEHIEAVKNVRYILAVPGIDAILIGPNDLSASMGLIGQYNHPEVRDAIQTTITAGTERGVPVGIFVGDPAAARAYIDAGCTLIVLTADVVYLWRAARQAISDVKRGANAPT
jgi:2-dehydro-3-deoxyglucarate aldolase/4-hydroxy-2-oxoheptanedioate aldolase